MDRIFVKRNLWGSTHVPNRTPGLRRRRQRRYQIGPLGGVGVASLGGGVEFVIWKRRYHSPSLPNNPKCAWNIPSVQLGAGRENCPPISLPNCAWSVPSHSSARLGRGVLSKGVFSVETPVCCWVRWQSRACVGLCQARHIPTLALEVFSGSSPLPSRVPGGKHVKKAPIDIRIRKAQKRRVEFQCQWSSKTLVL